MLHGGMWTDYWLRLATLFPGVDTAVLNLLLGPKHVFSAFSSLHGICRFSTSVGPATLFSVAEIKNMPPSGFTRSPMISCITNTIVSLVSGVDEAIWWTAGT